MAFTISFLSTPAVLLGLVAFIGLVAQKKKGTEVMTGTFKTIIGFMIFSSGGSIMTGALQNTASSKPAALIKNLPMSPPAYLFKRKSLNPNLLKYSSSSKCELNSFPLIF